MKIHDLTISEIRTQFEEGKLTPIELLDSLFERISTLEPYIEAWVTLIRDEARMEAEQLTKELDEGKIRGPLHGIPVGVKDIFYTAGIPTTMGSPIYEDYLPSYDAETVKRLRQAGIILMGKTETTEFANTDPAPTRNPWNLEYTPGGSSSGSAAAVSSGMVPLALGTQTGGSVIRPASYCGIVGFKPTYDSISRRGVYPLSWSLDHVGFFTRKVEDAAITLDVFTGNNSSGLLEKEMEPPKIGVVKEFFTEEAVSEVKGGYEKIIDKLDGVGAKLIDYSLPSSFYAIHSAHRVIMSTEAASVHEENYRRQPANYRPNISGMIVSGLLVPANAYLKAQRIRKLFIDELYVSIRDLDCLITPSSTTPALKGLESTGSAAFNAPWSLAGFPSITIPYGLTDNDLPLGLQLICGPHREEKLIRIAHWFEKKLDFPSKSVEPSIQDLQ
jgi:Asp-tRNA(Asn)/Glu-tRNA(Gln) amidotransferase A subunit family amidase